MDGGAWWAAVHGVARSQTLLRNFTFTFHFHALEKEMATHSSVLAWRIPGTGEPGGLLSDGVAQSQTRLKRQQQQQQREFWLSYWGRGLLLASSGQRPEMLVNRLQYGRQPLSTQISSSKCVNRSKFKKSR